MKLDKICEVHGNYLQKYAPWCDCEVLLKTIATIESSYGKFKKRYEKAYDFGGRYENKYLLEKYGKEAACSLSSFQIMFTTAVEMGFKGSPYELNYDEIAIYYVIEFIQRRILDKGANTLQQVFDAFNSGNFKDKNVPQEYIDKSINVYIALHKEKFGKMTEH